MDPSLKTVKELLAIANALPTWGELSEADLRTLIKLARIKEEGKAPKVNGKGQPPGLYAEWRVVEVLTELRVLSDRRNAVAS